MEIAERPELKNLSFPIPLFRSTHIADAVGRDGERFNILAGLTEALAGEVKRYSLDTKDREIQEQTSDYKRFGEGSYEEWYKKGRVPFALVHEAGGALAALAWFGPAVFDGAPPAPPGKKWHTLAYRSYAPYRGKGLMKSFARFTTELYMKLEPSAVLWARAYPGASVALAEKLGFVQVADSNTDATKIIMVQRGV